MSFQVGRQDVEDGREWLYDSRLDGIRVAYDHRQWRIEAMWGREELVRANLLKNQPVRRKVDNWLFHAEYEATPDWDISAYAIKQKDLRASNISPLTIGIQSEGRMGQIGHWLELAKQSGTSGTRKLRASAVDAGVIWQLPLPAKPALFAGYAYATSVPSLHGRLQRQLTANMNTLIWICDDRLNIRHYCGFVAACSCCFGRQLHCCRRRHNKREYSRRCFIKRQ